MTAIADSSALIALVKIGRLALLRQLYKEVLIPERVHHEVVVEGKRLRKQGSEEVSAAVKAGWIKTVPLSSRARVRSRAFMARGGIGQGEAEAIALAESHGGFIILDDRDARGLARGLGLEFMGTAAVLLEAQLRGVFGGDEFLESLRDLGRVMWLAPDVTAELVRRSREVDKP